MSNEIELLRRENMRLRLIVDVLSEKLLQTTTLLSAHTGTTVGGSNVDSADMKVTNGINNASLANVQTTDGVNHISLADCRVADGRNSVTLANVKTTDGINNTSLADCQFSTGRNNVASADLQIADGRNNVTSANVQMQDAAVGHHSPHGEDEKRARMLDLTSLKTRLRDYSGTSSWASLTHTAKLLMHLYITPRNSYKTLREVSGLSTDGLTKRIGRLKKKGFIVRTAFQEYTLTAKGRELVEVRKH